MVPPPLGGGAGTTFITRRVSIPDDDESPPPTPNTTATASTTTSRPGTAHSSQYAFGSGPAGTSSTSLSSAGDTSSSAIAIATPNAAPPPLPALPAELMEALSKEPPPMRSNPMGMGGSRSSTSINRSFSPSLPPASPSLESRSPALPQLAPHSPLNLSYRDVPSASSPSSITSHTYSMSSRASNTSEKRAGGGGGTTVTTASLRSKSSLGPPVDHPGSSSGSLPMPLPPGVIRSGAISRVQDTQTSDPPDQSAPGADNAAGGGVSKSGGGAASAGANSPEHDTSLGEGFVSVGQGDYASPTLPLDSFERGMASGGSSSKRSMWKSVGFGRTKSSDGTSTPPTSTSSSSWGRLGTSPGPSSTPRLGSGGRSPGPSLTTTLSSPLVPNPASPSSPSSSRLGSPSVSRSTSLNRLRGASGTGTSGKASATKWLYEAQAAVVSAGPGSQSVAGTVTNERVHSPTIARSASGNIVGLGFGDEIEASTSASTSKGVRMSTGSTQGLGSPAGKSPRPQSLADDSDDDSEGSVSWGGGGRGQQYTLDLAKGLRSGARPGATGAIGYDSEVEEEAEGDGEEADQTDNVGENEVDQLNLADEGGEGSRGEQAGEAESLFARRRQAGPAKLSTEGMGSVSASASGIPRTAPPISAATPRASISSADYAPDAVRNRSWSDGDVALSKAPYDGDLAKGMGIAAPPSEGIFQLQSEGRNRAKRAEFTIAVVGPRNVGKSTVIRKGIRGPTRPSVVKEDENGNRATSYTSNFQISGLSRTLETLEIDSGLLQFNSEGVIWPSELPACEGIMVCFDAQDPNAVPPLLALLQAFWTRGSGIPTIVLACKANPSGENAVDLTETAAKCNPFGPGIVSLDGGVDDKGAKMKSCINYVVRQIIEARGEIRPTSSLGGAGDLVSGSHPEITRVANALPSTTAPPQSPAVLSTDPSRDSTSGLSFDNPFSAALPSRSESSNGRPVSLGLEVVQEAPIGENPTFTGSPTQPDTQQSELPQPFPTRPPPSTTQETLDNLDKLNKTKSSALDLHFSREDMIDKFLFASVTGNDETYVTLFLIVYRRFVRPYDVVSKLIQRFEFVAGRLKTDPLLSRFAQMKLCGTLSTWFSYYPGDFSAPSTANLLRPFLEGLLPRGATWVAHHAAELLPLLNQIAGMPDPEASWALPDKPMYEQPMMQADSNQYRRPSLAPSYESAASSMMSSHHQLDSLDGNQSRLSVPGSLQYEAGSLKSESRARSGSDAAASDSNDRYGTTPAGRRARLGNEQVLLDLSNALLELPEETIAQQITRIAWISFSSMTPRDLMRHVLAPRDPKNPRALLRDHDSNVMQSINFVNYLADWVATMILVQSKLKWRARILEKFIQIAYQLRLLENFDSLMGVLAGLNSQPIFRLTETMETVNLKLEGDRSKIPKRLRSLNKLMATTKSFAAYRLALTNSGNDMLPYLGVHLQDITVVNEVKSDMRDGKVNWSKFSQMGKSAAIVLDCSRLPPQYAIDKNIEHCIVNVPVLDIDRQYALSYEYSPRAAQESGTSTRTRLRKLVGKVAA
ncbi:ras GEF [Meredithblackwellia eburnea MCA 4105]